MGENKELESIIIPLNTNDENAQDTILNKIQVQVDACIADPINPGKKIHESTLMNIGPKDTLDSLKRNFVNSHKKFKGNDYYVQYNNRLFTGGTVAQAGITNKKRIYLVSLGNQKVAVQNEGFKLYFWSIPFLMLAVSFLIAGLAGKFNTILRGAYVLIGSLFGVPSAVLLIIGLSERYSEKAEAAFTGEVWFGDCNCCCCKKQASTDSSSFISSYHPGA